MKIAVRPFSGADRDFVEDLAGRTVSASVPAFRHVPEVVAQLAVERLIETVEGRAHRLLIAEAGGIRTGFVLLIEDLPDEISSMPQGFAAYMAVEPAYRRRGIGAALLNAAEDEARRRGLPYMTLMVTEENAAARALYERAGYFTERRLLCKVL